MEMKEPRLLQQPSYCLFHPLPHIRHAHELECAHLAKSISKIPFPPAYGNLLLVFPNLQKRKQNLNFLIICIWTTAESSVDLSSKHDLDKIFKNSRAWY